METKIVVSAPSVLVLNVLPLTTPLAVSFPDTALDWQARNPPNEPPCCCDVLRERASEAEQRMARLAVVYQQQMLVFAGVIEQHAQFDYSREVSGRVAIDGWIELAKHFRALAAYMTEPPTPPAPI